MLSYQKQISNLQRENTFYVNNIREIGFAKKITVYVISARHLWHTPHLAMNSQAVVTCQMLWVHSTSLEQLCLWSVCPAVFGFFCVRVVSRLFPENPFNAPLITWSAFDGFDLEVVLVSDWLRILTVAGSELANTTITTPNTYCSIHTLLPPQWGFSGTIKQF